MMRALGKSPSLKVEVMCEGIRYSAALVKVFWLDGQSRVYTLTAGQPKVQLYGAADDPQAALLIPRHLNRFRDHGIAAFVLKYRLAREPGSTYTIETHAMADTRRALRMVRSRAIEWGQESRT